MDWLELTIRYLGIGLLSGIIGALATGALLFLAFAVMKFTPRLHAGKPTNDGELCFYDTRPICTVKDGEHRTISDRRMINAPLGIKWWFGVSYRGAPKWFIGFIRWEPKA